jgi:signal transduction histidine kinase
MHLDTDAEVLRLRAVLRDLVALSAIPAAWIGSEPTAVAAGLADTLIGLLQLDFAFVRLSDPGGVGAVEVTRGSAWPRFPEWLEGHLATSAPFPRKEVLPDAGDDSAQRRGFAVPVGVNGEGGLVAAASERSDFPTPMEQLLLSLAANHAAAAFQSARLIYERKRAEEELRKARDELEVKVAERTAELHVANDELGALRRVATLVAEGVQPPDLFAVVAQEVAHIVNVPLVNVVRYELDGTAKECASFSTEGPVFPVGKRWSLDGTNVLRLVRASSAPARIDDYSQLEGEIADALRRSGIRSTVGSPIVVAGRLWGAMVVSTTEEYPLPEGTEARLADFTELLATAIANAESREALEYVAEEQAALRRMATLVAEGVSPAEIFSAVSDEVGGLFGSGAAVLRFEDDPPAIVFVGVAKVEIPIGTRWEFQDGMASAEVYRTGCSARVDAMDWSSASGPVATAGRRLSVVSTVVSPVVVEGRLWGALSVSSSDKPLPVDTEERLEKFTELVATAIANADSRSELAASRRRIVAASDEARRRIERDLHDGTQQRLVSLGLAVRAAEANAPPDSSDLRAELSRIAIGLADAVEDLQEISRGIHPPILSQGGLGPALRTLARRSAIPVELDIATDARFPAPVEVAAYFVVSEALANATKHAQASASGIELSLATRNRSLILSIHDDGVGGADPARGSGLVGLTDRVEALGGSIVVRSRQGDGTHITAELPLELDVGEES